MNLDGTHNDNFSLIDIPANSTQLIELARDVEFRSGLMCVRTAAYLAGFASQLEALTTLTSVWKESRTILNEWSDKIKHIYAFAREYPPEFAIGVQLDDRIIIQQAPLAVDWCREKLAAMRIESSCLCDILIRAPGLGISNCVLARPDFFLAPMDTLEERRYVDGYDAYMADMADMYRLDPSKCLCELLWSRSKLQHVFVIIGVNNKPYLVRRDLGYCAEMTLGIDDIIVTVQPFAAIRFGSWGSCPVWT
ncbi:MAG: hypothetical protein JNG88_18435 [Phycisphaerales bacterium]|nr:hypothetical protein [Phycisphaerales bacterium]